MFDTDTFLTALYVMVDDYCKSTVKAAVRPGPEAGLTCSEVVTLAVMGQWSQYRSERDYYRYVLRHWRSAFPGLPERTQFNRLMRWHGDVIVGFFLHLVEVLEAQHVLYEALDSTAVPVRERKRRGAGWLAGQANIGWSNRLGWYEGFHLLMAVNPHGVITGFGFAPASVRDQPMAETFLAARHLPQPRLSSLGKPAQGYYVCDKGFEGEAWHLHWRDDYGAYVISPPKSNARAPWPHATHRWLASIRQIVESVFDKLHNTFRLSAERPHDLSGFSARLAAKMTLHNFCIWLNRQCGRPLIAFADLVDW